MTANIHIASTLSLIIRNKLVTIGIDCNLRYTSKPEIASEGKLKRDRTIVINVKETSTL